MSIRMPNSCFIHVPRTGGLWFGEVVRELGIKHTIFGFFVRNGFNEYSMFF